ncbi:hypothetical protein MKK51_23235 [Methylobacterium sp. E-045]|nr:hypothetical protein [Methylobacterium sp. E-045]
MIYTRNRFLIWAPRPGKRHSTPFKIGVDYAMADAFPLIEGDFPERIALAMEALEAAENKAAGITT